MKHLLGPSILTAALLLSPAFAWADTTVTTSGDTVTVSQTPNQTTTQTSSTQVIVQPAGTQTVLLQKRPVILVEQQDPRNLEGRIVKVNLVERELTVHDVNGRDRQVKMLKQSLINNYKTGDYVQIYLTKDLTEVKKIRTKREPDLEGDIVSVDPVANVIVVRDVNGTDRNAMIQPNMIRGYRVGDRVRFYVVSENTDLQEAQVIRIR
jgi:sulfite reductase alpha subunit-like flavoprotein